MAPFGDPRPSLPTGTRYGRNGPPYRRTMPVDELQPWWLAIAAGIATTLVGAIGKLWSENGKLRAELAECNGRLEHALVDAADRSDEAQRAHRRDLRSLVGLPSSTAPPQLPMSALDLPVIRAGPGKPRRAPRKA
jgi:hypothetical protein